MTLRDPVEFEPYEPLLWRMLGRLARDGYVLPPTEASEVIHDFFTEAWTGLTERYNAERGSLPGYIAAAFYRFARRRVLQLHNWRSRLATSGCLKDWPAQMTDPLEAIEQKEEADVFRNALHQLPANERGVLTDILNQLGTEREIAAKHGMTRHRLRETLVDSLGRLSTFIGSRLPQDSTDRAVVLALWRDGRNVRNAAALLGLNARDVRTVRERHVTGLLQAIRGQHQSPRSKETDTMSVASIKNIEPLVLLKKALLCCGNEKYLEDVVKSSDKIRKALEGKDLVLSEDELKYLGVHADWTAAVFEALGAESETLDDDKAIAEAMRQVREEEDAEIAEAFLSALAILPASFADWDAWFGGVERAPSEFQDYLREQPLARAAEGRADGLIAYGLTPATFLEASRGIELLTNRLIRTASWPEERFSSQSKELKRVYALLHQQHELGKPASVDLVGHEFRMDERNTPTIPYSVLLSEVRGTPQLPPSAAEPLLGWFLDAVEHIPRLILGYCAELLRTREVRLTEDPSAKQEILVKLWGSRRDANVEQLDEKALLEGLAHHR